MTKQQDTESLRAELKEASLLIADLNKRLMESEAMKSHFISNVMNEVYNPFTAILSLSEIIMGLADAEAAKSRELAGLIHQEAFQLDFQLQNVFAAAHIQAGVFKVHKTKLNLKELIEEVISYVKPFSKKKQVTVIFENELEGLNPVCHTDGKIQRLILSNLLSNAIKFSKKEADVILNISGTEQAICISVIDQGEGINESDLNRIYDSFKRVDDRINSVKGGYGLGLAVTKALSELIDADIQISSQPQKGSTISVLFNCVKTGSVIEEDFEEDLNDDAEIF